MGRIKLLGILYWLNRHRTIIALSQIGDLGDTRNQKNICSASLRANLEVPTVAPEVFLESLASQRRRCTGFVQRRNSPEGPTSSRVRHQKSRAPG